MVIEWLFSQVASATLGHQVYRLLYARKTAWHLDLEGLLSLEVEHAQDGTG